MGVHIRPWQVSLALAVLGSLLALCDAVRGAGQAGQVLSTLAPRCGEDQYWSAAGRHGRCVKCTHCSGPGREVTLRPCDGHRDAQCGSLQDLNIDWNWLRQRLAANDQHHAARKGGVHERINAVSEAEAMVLDGLHHVPRPASRGSGRSGHPAEHGKLVDFGDDYILPARPRQPAYQKEKKHHKKKPLRESKHLLLDYGSDSDFSDFEASGEVGDDVSDDEDLVASRRPHHHRPPTASRTTTTTTTTSTPAPATSSTTPRVSLVEDFIVVKESASSSEQRDDDGVSTTETFSTAETLVWDWQAGVLVAAVCACLLFFVVAAAYSCQHAWHFRALKKHLDADMEEISARLALMSSMGSEHLHDSRVGGGGGLSQEKTAMSSTEGEKLPLGRQQNDYCLATIPRKTRV